jgi:hypothetical protein
MPNDVSLATVARLHDLTTRLHVFIYFCPEAAEEYEKIGLEGWSGYFASRTAAMGPLSTEMVIATFYNFAPRRVTRAMEGVWETASPAQAQAARWEAASRVLEAKVRPVVSAAEVAEATKTLEEAVAGLDWSGRPMAAGNHAILADCPDNDLVRLWQLVTILREWRGDTHIGLLIAEPLSGVECSVVSYARAGGRGIGKGSRSWPDDEWNATLASLQERGLVAAEDALTDKGTEWRDGIEQRTNELAAPIWAGHDAATVNRLGDLLEKMADAVR